MRSVGYRNISIALFWTVLEKKGCSDNAERSGIVQQFIDEFGVGSIEFVTADREFASKEWLAFLVKNRIGFRLRIKANTLITDKRGRRIHASKMLKTMKIGARAEFQRSRKLWKQSVFVGSAAKRTATA
jgi:hypothetical protein